MNRRQFLAGLLSSAAAAPLAAAADGVALTSVAPSIVASLDSAFTEKEENDPAGFTVWGVWHDAELARQDLMRNLAAQATSLGRAVRAIPRRPPWRHLRPVVVATVGI